MKIRHVSALTLTLIIALLLCACGQAPAQDSPGTTASPQTTAAYPFDSVGFKNLVSSCTDTMSKNATLLSIVALYEQGYWESLEQLNGTVTAEKLTSAGYKYLAENTDYSKDDIAAWHDSIMASYKEIVSTEIDGAEAESIMEVFNEYLDAYLSLYNLATSPSGEVNEFADSYQSYTSIIDNCKAKLGALLS